MYFLYFYTFPGKKTSSSMVKLVFLNLFTYKNIIIYKGVVIFISFNVYSPHWLLIIKSTQF